MSESSSSNKRRRDHSEVKFEHKKVANRFVVDEATHDNNSVIAVLHPETMQKLELFPGDTILIKGKIRSDTVCVVDTDETCEEDKIKMNKVIRSNLRVSLGDMVSVHSCPDVPYGNKVHTLPLDNTIDVRTYLNKVEATLQNDDKYIMFCRIMRDFKGDRVDYVGLATRVQELFKGHDDLILGFNDFLPKKHKIILDDTVRFQEADNFINKVRLRFHHKEHIYKAFLDVLNLCQQGHRSVHYVYREVAALFKEHHDLLEEFERLISVEGFGVASCDDEKEKASNKKYNRGLEFCGKVQNKLCNSDDYQKFLKCLHYYSTGVISRSDLQCLVADVLQKDSGLVEEFDSFLNCCENIRDDNFPH